MTPRSSVRAAAREIYGELAAGEAATPVQTASTPLPNPPPHSSPDGERSLAYGGREKKEEGGGDDHCATAPDLTAKVRALYEGQAVPVAEIARLAGVSERTIYKYVAKGGWTRRHACPARDEAVAAAHRGRRSRSASAFKPAKGASGRFIRRADIGQPFAHGLKATDPAGRARAAAACARAEALASLARVQAQANKRHDALLRAIDATSRAFAALNRFQRTYRKTAAGRGRAPQPSPLQTRIEASFIRLVDVSVSRMRILADAAAG
jgi:hypothetical protein